MNYWQQFLWVIFPYLMLVTFFVGHIYRYETGQNGWTARSSEFLAKKTLKWGSILFHWGIVIAFIGHVGGIVIPEEFLTKLGISEALYHLGSKWIGGVAGLMAIAGILLLLARRLAVRRIRVTGSAGDLAIVILLVLVVGSGVFNTFGYTWAGGSFNYREVIGPWFRSVLLFRPDASLMSKAPLSFQFHILGAISLFGLWPFTRLVHVWSLPLKYFGRSYIVYRRVN